MFATILGWGVSCMNRSPFDLLPQSPEQRGSGTLDDRWVAISRAPVHVQQVHSLLPRVLLPWPPQFEDDPDLSGS